jgi:hypothetical protein
VTCHWTHHSVQAFDTDLSDLGHCPLDRRLCSSFPAMCRQLCRHEEEMAERMDASVKRVLQQNRRAAHELQLHIEQSTLLHKENKILMEERRQLMQARPSTFSCVFFCSSRFSTSVGFAEIAAHQCIAARYKTWCMQAQAGIDLEPSPAGTRDQGSDGAGVCQPKRKAIARHSACQ